MSDSIDSLDGRYTAYAWGMFFILLGVLIIIPGNQLRIFILGTGITLLALNLARYYSKIGMNIVTTTLGLMAILLAASAILLHRLGIHFELPLFSILLIGIGVMMLMRMFISVITSKAQNHN